MGQCGHRTVCVCVLPWKVFLLPKSSGEVNTVHNPLDVIWGLMHFCSLDVGFVISLCDNDIHSCAEGPAGCPWCCVGRR